MTSSADDAVAAARGSDAVALKIARPPSRKTDVGGVRLDVPGGRPCARCSRPDGQVPGAHVGGATDGHRRRQTMMGIVRISCSVRSSRLVSAAPRRDRKDVRVRLAHDHRDVDDLLHGIRGFPCWGYAATRLRSAHCDAAAAVAMADGAGCGLDLNPVMALAPGRGCRMWMRGSVEAAARPFGHRWSVRTCRESLQSCHGSLTLSSQRALAYARQCQSVAHLRHSRRVPPRPRV
jgi:hypothetical protein